MGKEFIDLGVIKEILPSGMRLTDKDLRTHFAGQVGQRIQMDLSTRKVSVSPKANDEIDPKEYEGLDAQQLADKFNLTELKKIVKAKGGTNYSKKKEPELIAFILTGSYEIPAAPENPEEDPDA